MVLVERDAFAAAVLVARMAEASLAEAPVWDDVSTFDGRRWRGVVDCVAGGSPCQDLSVAGKRAGLAGERSGLWKQMLRVVDEAGPAFVFWENVGGAISSALDVVAEDLEGRGFRVAACTVLASDVGAPHERKRLFVLAHSERNALRQQPEPERWSGGASVVADAGGAVADADRHGREGQRLGGVLDGERAALGRDADGRSGAAVANTSGLGWGQGRPQSDAGGGSVLGGPGQEQTVGDASSAGQAGQPRQRNAAWAAQRFPPGPSASWGAWDGPQPSVRRGAHGAVRGVDLAYSNERLRVLGNGVVWQQAAAAFLVCWQRLFA